MVRPDDSIEKLSLWSNPDYNEVIIFYGLQAISFRDRKKANHLYELIKFNLQKIKCNSWPYEIPILVTISIAGPTKLYSRRDVDNMSKVILDSGNKIIYEDDRLVNILVVEKQLWEIPLYGFQLGIRVLNSETKDKYSPILYFTTETNSRNIKTPHLFLIDNEADRKYCKSYKGIT